MQRTYADILIMEWKEQLWKVMLKPT
jgi:hypothetical protein